MEGQGQLTPGRWYLKIEAGAGPKEPPTQNTDPQTRDHHGQSRAPPAFRGLVAEALAEAAGDRRGGRVLKDAVPTRKTCAGVWPATADSPPARPQEPPRRRHEGQSRERLLRGPRVPSSGVGVQGALSPSPGFGDRRRTRRGRGL